MRTALDPLATEHAAALAALPRPAAPARATSRDIDRPHTLRLIADDIDRSAARSRAAGAASVARELESCADRLRAAARDTELRRANGALDDCTADEE